MQPFWAGIVSLLMMGENAKMDSQVVLADGRSSMSQNVPSGLPGGRKFSHFQIANGLELFVVENHAVPLFNFQIWYQVGSKHEKLDSRFNKTGMAHLFEHMMFRGTKKYEYPKFDRMLTRAGSTPSNATTWLDRTNYFVGMPKSELDLILNLEADRMQNLDLSQSLFDKERGSVLGERALMMDDPRSLASDMIFELALTKHPYRYSTIGTEAEIKSVTIDEAMAFYKSYYAPNNAAIFVSGDVDPADVLQKVLKYFGQIPASTIPSLPKVVEPEQTAGRSQTFKHAQLQSPYLVMGFVTPVGTHADAAALWVLHAMLSTGQGALLQAAWVNKGLASGLGGGFYPLRDMSFFEVHADVQKNKTAEDLVAAWDGALGALDARFLDRDLERAKNQILLSTWLDWEKNQDFAFFMGDSWINTGEADLGFKMIDRVSQVTAQDVVRVAQKYLTAARRNVLIGMPKGDAP